MTNNFVIISPSLFPRQAHSTNVSDKPLCTCHCTLSLHCPPGRFGYLVIGSAHPAHLASDLFHVFSEILLSSCVDGRFFADHLRVRPNLHCVGIRLDASDLSHDVLVSTLRWSLRRPYKRSVFDINYKILSTNIWLLFSINKISVIILTNHLLRQSLL